MIMKMEGRGKVTKMKVGGRGGKVTKEERKEEEGNDEGKKRKEDGEG